MALNETPAYKTNRTMSSSEKVTTGLNISEFKKKKKIRKKFSIVVILGVLEMLICFLIFSFLKNSMYFSNAL